MVTLELFCAVADNLSFYSDRNANENFLATCTQRASGLKFAKFANYSIRQNTSAVVDITFTVSGAGTIAAGFQVGSQETQAQEALTFELRSAITAIGAGTYVGEVIEGETSEEILGSSDATADQSFELENTPLAFDPDGTSSLQVWVKDGANPWEQYTQATDNDFSASTATSKHYIVNIDEFDIVEVQFGDGVNGIIPPSGTDNIKAIGRFGGGLLGNQVGQSLITEILESSPGIVTAVTNGTNVPQGGQDKETLDELKTNIPDWIRRNDRCVTEEDYAAAALTIGGVGATKAARGESNYQMNIYVRAAGTNPNPSGTWNARTESGTGLLGQIGAYVNARREGPVELVITGPYLVRTFITADVYVKDTYFQWEVQESVERAISACLNGYEIDSDGSSLGDEDDIPTNAPLPKGFPRTMGNDLKLSYFHQMLESIAGVDYVDIKRFQRDPYARKLTSFGSDATFGQITVGNNTVRETWTVKFLSETTFEVYGSIAGLQTATGTVGVAYTSDGSEISFTITAGSIPNFKENRYEIVVGPYLNNLEMGNYELLTNYVGLDTVYATHTLNYSGGIVRS
jgi:hypothetical protein